MKRMKRAKVRAIVWTVLAISGVEIQAQTTPVEPLSPPLNETIVCEATPDPEGIILEFTDRGRSFSKRETTLGFDAAGTPRQISLSAQSKSLDGRTVHHIVVVRFGPLDEGAVAVVSGFDPNFRFPLERPDEKIPPGWRVATRKEVKQARALALDFWERRCGKDRGFPSPPRPPSTD
jgi:hypothetical protein